MLVQKLCTSYFKNLKSYLIGSLKRLFSLFLIVFLSVWKYLRDRGKIEVQFFIPRRNSVKIVYKSENNIAKIKNVHQIILNTILLIFYLEYKFYKNELDKLFFTRIQNYFYDSNYCIYVKC